MTTTYELPPMPAKFCHPCQETKPIYAFGSNRSNKDGVHCYCTDCRRLYEHMYRRNNWDKCQRRSWKHDIKHKYGVTVEDYDRMMEEQGGVCRICKKPPERRRLDVDHCHYTGKVRGLLCPGCNQFVGKIEHNREKVTEIEKYLDRHIACAQYGVHDRPIL